MHLKCFALCFFALFYGHGVLANCLESDFKAGARLLDFSEKIAMYRGLALTYEGLEDDQYQQRAMCMHRFADEFEKLVRYQNLMIAQIPQSAVDLLAIAEFAFDWDKFLRTKFTEYELLTQADDVDTRFIGRHMGPFYRSLQQQQLIPDVTEKLGWKYSNVPFSDVVKIGRYIKSIAESLQLPTANFEEFACRDGDWVAFFTQRKIDPDQVHLLRFYEALEVYFNHQSRQTLYKSQF